MRTLLPKLTLVLIIMGLINSAEASLRFTHPFSRLHPSARAKGNTCLPFDYVNRLIRIRAEISGSGKEYDFILDSGAPTFVTDTIISSHHPGFQETEVARDVNGHEIQVDKYIVEGIDIGGRTFKQVPVRSSGFVKKMPSIKNRANGGLIGADLMKESIWMIDYRHRTITLAESTDSLHLPENAPYTRMRLNEHGNPVIQGKLSGQLSIPLVIDLGYNGTVLLPKRYMRSSLFVDSLREHRVERVSTGFHTSNDTIKYEYLNNLTSGLIRFDRVKTFTTGRNERALLGNELFENHIIVLDFIHGRFYVLDMAEDGTLMAGEKKEGRARAQVKGS